MESKSQQFGHVSVTREQSVFILSMNDGENRFNPTSLAHLHAALDYIESSQGAAALITTGSGKFYSNGLDLNWISANGMEGFKAVAMELERLMSRILVMNMPTFAVLNGHCFAGGALWAMCHDYRLMRDDRGYICFPEIDIHIPFTPGMAAVLGTKISDASTLRDVVLTGARFSAQQALKMRLIDGTFASDVLLSSAVQKAESLAPKAADRKTFKKIKEGMYPDAFAKLANAELIDSLIQSMGKKKQRSKL